MKDKLLNYTILFLIFFIIVSFFSNSNNNKTSIDETVKLTSEKSYTVPASVKLNVKNNTSTWFTFDTCKDLQIKKDSKVIVNDKCENITLKSWETKVVDFSTKYLSFENIWTYQAILKKDKIEVILEKGLCCDGDMRDSFNLEYFLDLEKNQPKWPWRFVVAKLPLD